MRRGDPDYFLYCFMLDWTHQGASIATDKEAPLIVGCLQLNRMSSEKLTRG